MSSAARLRAQGQPIGDVYLDRAVIAARVAELGAALAAAYAGRLPLLVAPLKSSAVFLADLSRALPNHLGAPQRFGDVLNGEAAEVRDNLCSGHASVDRRGHRDPQLAHRHPAHPGG